MAYWADRDRLWLSLTPAQKAAAMALMEANSGDAQGAVNVLGAIYNRAEADGHDLTASVSGKRYQPTIEDTQRARLPQIVNSPAFQHLTGIAERRGKGEIGDWVQGATHFLAPEKTMLALEAKEPSKYKNWGPRGANWTNYNPETGSYQGVVMRDDSHAFLRPDGQNPKPQSQPSQNAKGKPMFDIAMLAKLFGGGGPAAAAGPGVAGSAVPKMASAANPGTDMQNLFGSLSNFAPGGQDAQSSGQQSGADSSLAAQAMQNAQGGDEGGMQMQQRPVDMQRLGQMLQQTGKLGIFRPRMMG
jgi:hypothetical protein